jgi:hypothetical protein
VNQQVTLVGIQEELRHNEGIKFTISCTELQSELEKPCSLNAILKNTILKSALLVKEMKIFRGTLQLLTQDG